MMDAFMLYQTRRVNIKGREYLQGPGKYYPADLSIRNTPLGYPTGDYGFLLENTVHNELKICGYDIQVERMGTREIDFINALDWMMAADRS